MATRQDWMDLGWSVQQLSNPMAGLGSARPASKLALALARFFRTLKVVPTPHAPGPDIGTAPGQDYVFSYSADASMVGTLAALKVALGSQESHDFLPAQMALAEFEDLHLNAVRDAGGVTPSGYRRYRDVPPWPDLGDENTGYVTTPFEFPDVAVGDVIAGGEPTLGRASPELVRQAAEKAAADDTIASTVAVEFDDLLKTDEERNAYFEAFGADSAAAFIRSARTKAGMTQTELAKRMGVNQSRIAELERGGGRQGVTTGLLARVAQACNKKLLLTLQ